MRRFLPTRPALIAIVVIFVLAMLVMLDGIRHGKRAQELSNTQEGAKPIRVEE